MITTLQINSSVNAREQREMPFGLGNTLFMIAGVIGLATKRGFDYGFPAWINQEHFINPLPLITNQVFKPFRVPPTYKNFDVGYVKFNVPDNVAVYGYLGSERYFEHCPVLIRHYFTMKPVCSPIKDTILIHYRHYNNPTLLEMDEQWYKRALERLPKKPVVVVTDNIPAAQSAIKLKCDYVNNSPISDFYLLTQADYLIISPSTFSWWGAWLSGAQTVAPRDWFTGEFKDCPFNRDWHSRGWIVI